jgi:uncharacterized protein (DUF1499 family)
VKRRILIGFAAIIGVLVIAVLAASAVWPVINDVETGKTAEYPDVRPHYYSADPKRVFGESIEAVGDVERMEVVEVDRGANVVKATRTTRLFGFVDDVTITVSPVTEFVTEVNVRSASRVGKGDFGQNARNIEAYLGALDERLGAVKFDPDELREPAETGDEAAE